MNYFDWELFLPRRVRQVVTASVLAGLLFVPGPTSHLIDEQIQLRATEIATSLDALTEHLVANMMRTEPAQIARSSPHPS